MSNCGVYEIRNLVDGMRYVGGSSNISSRKSSHLSSLRSGRNKNTHLQKAWDDYGESSFDFVVVLSCNIEELLSKEQERINMYDFGSLYNVQPLAGSPLGQKLSEEARRNISQGKIGGTLSQDHRDAISKTKMGSVASEEARLRMSMSQTGRKHSDETLRKMSIAQKGRTVSMESREKISASMKGNKSCVGRVYSEETRAKMSASHRESELWRGKTHSQETIQKMSDAHRRRWAQRRENAVLGQDRDSTNTGEQND